MGCSHLTRLRISKKQRPNIWPVRLKCEFSTYTIKEAIQREIILKEELEIGDKIEHCPRLRSNDSRFVPASQKFKEVNDTLEATNTLI